MWTEIAVGVGPGAAVFVTSDGLGCPTASWPAGWAASSRGARCSKPLALNLAGPFATVATTDAGAAAFGALTLPPDEIAAVSITAGTVGVDSFADVAGQVAGLLAETGFTAPASTATAVAAAVTSPGNDADSVLAVAQNNAATAAFVAALSAGIEQLGGAGGSFMAHPISLVVNDIRAPSLPSSLVVAYDQRFASSDAPDMAQDQLRMRSG